MSKGLLYALLSVSPLVLGPLLGLWLKLSKRKIAVLLAFAAGTFIAALAFDLFAESFSHGGALVASAGLLVGAAVYISLNQILSWRAGRASRGGLLLAAGAGLDGVPESVALGTTLALGAGSLPLLAAIMISNFPEGLASAGELRRAGRSYKFVMLLWVGMAVVLAPFVLLGAMLSGTSPLVLASIQSFAAGAVLGLIADTMLPQAYDEGGPWVAFATAAGFLLSFMLGKL